MRGKPFTINPHNNINPWKPSMTGPTNYLAGLTPQNWLSYAYNQAFQGGFYNNGTLGFSENKDGSLAYAGSLMGPNGAATFNEQSPNGVFHQVFFTGKNSPAGLIPAQKGWLTPDQFKDKNGKPVFKGIQNADGSTDWSGKLEGTQITIHQPKGDQAWINPAAMEVPVVKNAPAPPQKPRPDVPQAPQPAGNALADANAPDVQPGFDPAAAAQLAAMEQQNQGSGPVVAALQNLYQKFEEALMAHQGDQEPDVGTA